MTTTSNSDVGIATGETLTAIGPRTTDKSHIGRYVWSAILFVVLLVLCLAPIVLVVLGSVISFENPSGYFTGEAWSRLLENGDTIRSIKNTFLLAIRLPIALVVALPFAWMLVRLEIPGHQLITYGLWVAFFLPALPMALGWVLLLDPDYGLLNKLFQYLPFGSGPLFNIYSMSGIIWVHLTLSTIPIMTILLSSAQRQIDASYEEAATMSGASLSCTLRRIIGPLLLPSILTALVAGLFASVQVFEVEQLLGVPVGIGVFSTQIYGLLVEVPSDEGQAMAFSSLMLGILVVVGVVYQILLNRRGAVATMSGRGVRVAVRPKTRMVYIASGLIFLALGIGIVLPAVVLLASSFTRLFGFFDIPAPWTTQHWSRVFSSEAFGTALRNTVILGLTLGVVGTFLYACLAWLLARSVLPGMRLVSLLIWLPWGVPGILLGVAFLYIFLTVPILRELYGTMLPLIIVLIVAQLPFGTYMLRSSVEQISTDLEEAAYMSGATKATVWRRITIPLMVPMLICVFVINFMIALRDISMTVLLATPGIRTLPLAMFSFASEGDRGSASVVGVVMTIAALVMTIIASRVGRLMSR